MEILEKNPIFSFCLIPTTEKYSLEEAEFLSSSEETQKLYKFLDPKRQNSFLAGRIAAKRLIRSELEIDPDMQIEVRNSKSEEKKGLPQIFINSKEVKNRVLSISHSEDLACAILSTKKVGADIELVETRHPALVEEAFTESEQTYFHNLQDKDLMITMIWSAKEAVLKSLGTGLLISAKSVEIIFSKNIEAYFATVNYLDRTYIFSVSSKIIEYNNKTYCLSIALLENLAPEVINEQRTNH